jgi:hypothetical protein
MSSASDFRARNFRGDKSLKWTPSGTDSAVCSFIWKVSIPLSPIGRNIVNGYLPLHMAGLMYSITGARSSSPKASCATIPSLFSTPMLHPHPQITHLTRMRWSANGIHLMRGEIPWRLMLLSKLVPRTEVRRGLPWREARIVEMAESMLALKPGAVLIGQDKDDYTWSTFSRVKRYGDT